MGEYVDIIYVFRRIQLEAEQGGEVSCMIRG